MSNDPETLSSILSEGYQPQPNSKPASESPSDEDEYTCETCKDQGWLSEEAELVRCHCRSQQDQADRDARLLRYCRLPAGTEHMTFGNFKERPGLEMAHAAAAQLAGGLPMWLTLISNVDAGKSHLAVAVARKWLSRFTPARYALVPKLLDDLRKGYDPRNELSFDQEFDILCDTPLLILDDLGMESSTPWANEKLEMLVEIRAASGLPLMVTTNLSLDALSPRIASRLQRYRPGKVVVIDAPEFRVWNV